MASCSDWPGRFHMLTDPPLYLPGEKNGLSLKVWTADRAFWKTTPGGLLVGGDNIVFRFDTIFNIIGVDTLFGL